MAIHGGTHFVISANFTDSGAPAYLAAGGEWVREFQRAAPIETESERDALLNRALEQERLVCDPYFFDVRLEGGVIDPISTRERIRADGPTVRIRRPDTDSQERSQEPGRELPQESASKTARESA